MSNKIFDNFSDWMLKSKLLVLCLKAVFECPKPAFECTKPVKISFWALLSDCVSQKSGFVHKKIVLCTKSKVCFLASNHKSYPKVGFGHVLDDFCIRRSNPLEVINISSKNLNRCLFPQSWDIRHINTSGYNPWSSISVCFNGLLWFAIIMRNRRTDVGIFNSRCETTMNWRRGSMQVMQVNLSLLNFNTEH